MSSFYISVLLCTSLNYIDKKNTACVVLTTRLRRAGSVEFGGRYLASVILSRRASQLASAFPLEVEPGNI